MPLSAIEFLDFPGTATAVVRRDGLRTDAMEPFMDSSFTALGAAIEAGVVVPTGPAFARYNSEFTDTVDIETGFPVDEPLMADYQLGETVVVASDLPAGRLATVKYKGGYDGLADAWAEFVEKVVAEGYEILMPSWEAYDTEPTPETDPADLVTGLAVLVRKS